MSSLRFPGTRWLAAPASAIALVAGLAAFQGCSAEPEFDKSTLHTPESLVQEFMIRYKRLPEHATARQKAQADKSAKALAKLADPDAPSGKSQATEAVKKKAVRETLDTLDNLIDTLATRLGELKGISRSDAAKQAAELIRKEPTIREDDRKAVLDRLGKL